MSDGNAALSWLVIRQDDNGNRYRVGRYATEDEARRMADTLDAKGHHQLYSVEQVEGSAH
ncbi:SPOR domain-containing protein [Streptomyces sp. NPDC058953]|uniref:SPOR domain-containing protein n=1 Tax=unclassified Streptomyces TaxID=2593676 RepID=UPI0036BD2C79